MSRTRGGDDAERFITTLRLTLRLHRFEVVLFGLVFAALGVLGFGLSIAFDTAGVANCLTAGTTPICVELLARAELLAGFRAPFGIILTFVSSLAGIVLGIGVVGTEIERRTTVLAWTLYPSRLRWLLPRVAITALLLTVLVAPAATAADLFEHVRQVPPLGGDSIVDYGLRGLPVVARGWLAFSLAALVGAWVGRALPALLVAAVLFIGIGGAIEIGLSSWLETSAAPLETPAGAIYLREAYLDHADGDRVLESAAAFGLLSPDDPAFSHRFSSIPLGISGDHGGVAAARAVAVDGLLGLSLLLLTAGVVRRRQP